MARQAETPTGAVRKQLKAISLTATVTLATFGVLVMALPAFDFWFQVLPPPGRYGALARAAGLLLSALLAYREVRHEWRTRWDSPVRRPSGVLQVILGGLLTLVYLETQQMSLGEWADLIFAIEYSGIVILLSFGFIRLAKKAYDFARPIGRGQSSLDDFRFLRFVTIFFAGITASVTGFAVLNQIITVLPPIIRNLEVINALSVLIATILVGSNYTADFLERNLAISISRSLEELKRRQAGKNVVEAGIIPVSIGLVCLVLFLAGDSILHSRSSDNVLVDMLLSILQIGIFSSISFGLWRLGVYEYVRRKERPL